MDYEGAFRTELFERYQRGETALMGTLMALFLDGVSTRKACEVAEALCGTSFGIGSVSWLVGDLDTDLATLPGAHRVQRSRGFRIAAALHAVPVGFALQPGNQEFFERLVARGKTGY